VEVRPRVGPGGIDRLVSSDPRHDFREEARIVAADREGGLLRRPFVADTSAEPMTPGELGQLAGIQGAFEARHDFASRDETFTALADEHWNDEHFVSHCAPDLLAQRARIARLRPHDGCIGDAGHRRRSRSGRSQTRLCCL
jgi:hypothetical protein